MDWFDKILGNYFTGEEIQRKLEKGEIDESEAADWAAEAAGRKYAENKADKEELQKYQEQAIKINKQQYIEDETPETPIEMPENIEIPTLSPTYPERDRAKRKLVDMLQTKEVETEADVIVSAGAGNIPIAEMISKQTEGSIDISTALERKPEHFKNVDYNERTGSHLYEEGNYGVEIMGEDIQGKDVIIVSDIGIKENDRYNVKETIKKYADTYQEFNMQDDWV